MNDIEKYIAEMEEQKSRLKEWLSSENLEYAKGKTREEIFNLFDNTPLPIAMLPLYYLQFFNDTTDDNKIYSGKAYYLDHAVNHHPDVNIDVYLNLQEIFIRRKHFFSAWNSIIKKMSINSIFIIFYFIFIVL